MNNKRNPVQNTRLIKLLHATLFTLLSLLSESAVALTFQLPSQSDVVGDVQMTKVQRGESLGDIGRRYDIGVYEMIEANPQIDPWIPATGSIVVVPTQFILPSGPRRGIVLNLAEMRLYYFHADKPLVTTHPVGIGKKGWSTPLVGETKILGKKKDPCWVPPESIRREHIAKGDILPAVVPAGPDNPLGRYAFYLGMEGSIRIHGTNKPGGIGVRGTHGCIRLYPEDIESLYYSVPVGTTVRITHEPYKVGWHNDHLYLEAHQPFTEPRYAGSDSITNLTKTIERAIDSSHLVNWTSAKMAAKTQNGYPIRID
jgi:L,D-transpeptidase ErfK/SrfK